MRPSTFCHNQDKKGRWTKSLVGELFISLLLLFKCCVRTEAADFSFVGKKKGNLNLSWSLPAHFCHQWMRGKGDVSGDQRAHMQMNGHGRTRTQMHVKSTYTHAHTHISRADSVGNAMLTCVPRTVPIKHTPAHMHACMHARSCTPLLFPHSTPAVLPPDLPQLQDVKHGLKDPHADGAAPLGGPDSPRCRRRGRGRVNRGSIRSVPRHRGPTALVAVLGA